MRNLLKGISLSFLGLLLFGTMASGAYALSYNLNCVLSGSGCAPSGTFGTLNLNDNGNNVNIFVDLGGSSVHKIMSVYLNYNDALFSNADNFGTTNGTGNANAGVIEGENARQADGYSTGKFDLTIPEPPPGNLGFEPYIDNITLSGFNLDPSHFDYLDSSGLLYGAVHIGRIACANFSCLGQAGEDSLWVGATRTPQIPEPATLLLLGSGLTGLWLFGRRKNQDSV